MGKLRCSNCKELAHVLINKRAYCLACAPISEEPKLTEVKKTVKDKLPTKIVLNKIGDVEIERIEQRKSWWRKNKE